MPVVTRMPHIEIKITEPIPKKDISMLEKKFSNLLRNNISTSSNDREYVDIEDTDWYEEISKKRNPGYTVKIYRENTGLTQNELGKKLGNFSSKYISDIENNRRTISKEMAKKLSKLFKISINRLI